MIARLDCGPARRPLEVIRKMTLEIEGPRKHTLLRGNPAELMEDAVKRGVEMVDLKFTDLPGIWQHMQMPIEALDADDFEKGLGFDGSSIRGFQTIDESDMLLLPDPATAIVDPFYDLPTLSLVCSVADPVTHEPYSRDPRYIAVKAQRHLADSGIADIGYFGPEAEFFVFDHIAYEQREHKAFYEVDSSEGFWNSGLPPSEQGNLAYTLRQKEGYFPVPPADSLANLRAEMVATMRSLGIACEFHHHEVSSGGQGEIDMRFQPLLTWPTSSCSTSTSSATSLPATARSPRSCPSRSSRRTAPGCTSTSPFGRATIR
jgi:glutamine synthetase